MQLSTRAWPSVQICVQSGVQKAGFRLHLASEPIGSSMLVEGRIKTFNQNRRLSSQRSGLFFR